MVKRKVVSKNVPPDVSAAKLLYELDGGNLNLKDLSDEELEKEKSSLSVDKEDKVIVIKKSVPILQSCVENYNMLQPKDKNRLLKSIFNAVYYTKLQKGTEFEILPEFKI